MAVATLFRGGINGPQSSVLLNIPFARFKGTKVTAQMWLKRQIRDPLVKEARVNNWRCRSAFKLLEIDDKFRLFRPGFVVVDCGAAPGSWTQVAAERVNATGKDAVKQSGKVIGIDLLPIAPIEGATIIGESDFTDKVTQAKIIDYLNGEKANVVLSDMAPNATGVKSMDHELIIDLCTSALRFSLGILRTNGSFVCKLWQGNEQKMLENVLQQLFTDVRIIKPKSSRKESAEIFYVATKFKNPTLK